MLQEYGLPSSHTMNSLCLNFFVVHYILDKRLVPAEWAVALYVGTAVWVAWIGLARVYMGLHTPIDIGAGVVLGILVLVFYLAVDGKLALSSGFHLCTSQCEYIAATAVSCCCIVANRLLGLISAVSCCFIFLLLCQAPELAYVCCREV